MTISIAALAAAALVLHAPGEQAVPPVPPVPPATSNVDAAAAQMRVVFAAEVRTRAWADEMERVLRRRYLAVQGVDAAALRVSCRATLCEVRGGSAAGIATAAGKRAAEALASPALRNGLLAQSLHADVTSMRSEGRDDGRGFRFEFLHYWRRTDGG